MRKSGGKKMRSVKSRNGYWLVNQSPFVLRTLYVDKCKVGWDFFGWVVSFLCLGRRSQGTEGQGGRGCSTWVWEVERRIFSWCWRYNWSWSGRRKSRSALCFCGIYKGEVCHVEMRCSVFYLMGILLCSCTYLSVVWDWEWDLPMDD